MRRVRVPWALLAIGGIALVVLSIQGLRMARDRQERLQPMPVTAEIRLRCSPPTTELEILRPTRRSCLLMREECDSVGRIAVLEELPQRTVLRWLEAGGSRTDLVVPLEGLGDGIYRIVTLPDRPVETTREMDRPPEEWPLRARLLLRTVDR